MSQKIKILLTVLMAVAFLTSANPMFAASSTKTDDSKKTTTSKSKKSTKKSSKAPFTGKININKASKEDLMKLPGIGEVKATEILKARKKFGKFKNADDLMKVSGVGEKTAKGLAKHLTF